MSKRIEQAGSPQGLGGCPAYRVEYGMFARLLPQTNDALIAHELHRMGCSPPAGSLEGCLVSKLIGVPDEIASLLIAWLQQQGAVEWWYRAPGADTTTVDVMFAGRVRVVTALRQAAAHRPLLQPVIAALEAARHLQEHGPSQLWLGERHVNLQHRPYVMGILNVTPDSFSDGGLYLQPEQAIKHAEAMLVEGADIIDVGGQSSRPGALPIPPEVEHQRVIPVIRDLVKHFDALVSIDTTRARIAEAALDAGAVLVNDISAMRFDPQMMPLIARRKAAVVLMHMQGTPQTMQRAPAYRHVIDEVYGFLLGRLQHAIQHDIARQRIVLDPGFGFGKTVQHNLELLQGVAQFRALGQPLLVGTSRKSFLGYILQREVWDRLEGTLASVIYALLQGATLVRVHDVKPVVQAVRLLEAVQHPFLTSPYEPWSPPDR